MKRIMVIGSCGAGKSTLSRELKSKTGLDLIHLDQHYWNPGWVETEKKEWVKKHEELILGDEWIIDGNYGGTMDQRIQRADTIVYLDKPTWICFKNIIKRHFKYRGRTRPDMTANCIERFDWEFYHYVLTFNITRRKAILKRLKKVSGEKNIIILRNYRQIRKFLLSLSPT